MIAVKFSLPVVLDFSWDLFVLCKIVFCYFGGKKGYE